MPGNPKVAQVFLFASYSVARSDDASERGHTDDRCVASDVRKSSTDSVGKAVEVVDYTNSRGDTPSAVKVRLCK